MTVLSLCVIYQCNLFELPAKLWCGVTSQVIHMLQYFLKVLLDFTYAPIHLTFHLCRGSLPYINMLKSQGALVCIMPVCSKTAITTFYFFFPFLLYFSYQCCIIFSGL